MKKFLVLIFGSLIALPALCQLPDTATLGSATIMVFPKPIQTRNTKIALFKLEYAKTIDALLNTGGLINYQPESNTGNNAPNTMVRVLASQIPLTADVKVEERVLLQKIIDEIVKPGIYELPTTPTPTAPVFKEFVNDHSPAITYQPGWIKAANQVWIGNRFANSDVSISYNVGIIASYQFTGRKVEVVAEKCDNHDKAKIVIKKAQTVVKSEVVDMYQSTGTTTNPAGPNNWCPLGVVTTIFTSGDLPLDTYTVEVSLESKNMTTVPARDSFVFDGLKIYE